MSSFMPFLRSCTCRVMLCRTSCVTASVRHWSPLNTTVPVLPHRTVLFVPKIEELSNHISKAPTYTTMNGSARSQQIKIEYHLPTIWYNGIAKKSIVDPLSSLKAYDLPTLHGIINVKEMPAVSSVHVPVTDPVSSTVIEKVTMPYLITIRHKKMKKHQRRKLRKRMRFVRRKRKAEKRRRREREVQEYERKMAKEGTDYDAVKYVEGQLLKARNAGWGIDIVAEYAKKRATVGDQNSNE